MGFQNTKTISVKLAILLFFMGLIWANIPQRHASAAPNDVVINEIMYHASSDDENDEFLELYNTTGSPIDLDGWCFTDGIDLCFTSGQTIAANDYLIVSPDNSQTNTTYGVTPPYGEYTGKLSNGGETITLEDNTSTVVSTVTYSDSTPWPITPDELGPSLELIDPSGDISNPLNWGASTDDYSATPGEHYTPNAQNNIFTNEYPDIADVTDPNDVEANVAVPVTANIGGTGITGVNLVYKTNFDDEITVAMADDGASNDGAASDGVYGASIPGQAATTLVRFRIDATNNSGTMTSPKYDDTQRYHGYYIADSSITSNLPILEWFIADADYTDMLTNHVFDNEYLPSVVVYGNEVFDGSEVRVRGETSRLEIKKSFKFNLPRNYSIKPQGAELSINQFAINADISATNAKYTSINWATKQAGLPTSDVLQARVHKNGEFYGLYTYIDKYDKEWRSANDYDIGELYEDADEVVSGAGDTSRLTTLKNNTYDVSQHKSQAQYEYLLDEFEIPKVISSMVTVGALHGWDHATDSNMFQYYDTSRGRWSNLLWDQNGIFQRTPTLSPYDFRTGRIEQCYTQCPIYNFDDLRSMYLRRYRTIVDTLYSSDALKNKMVEQNALSKSEMELDLAKWPNSLGGPRTFAISDLLKQYEDTKSVITNLYQLPWALPNSQTTAEKSQVSIGEVNPDADNSNEYIRLDNAASTAVDISGWRIQNLNYTFNPGSVIPAGGSVYILKDDLAYKAANLPLLVVGEYDNDLNDLVGLDLVLTTNENVEIDTYDY